MKSKDFPVPTAIFKNFQGLVFYKNFLKFKDFFKDFQGACEPWA